MLRLKNPTYLEISLLVLAVILLLVWILPNTIALRNTCLIGGGIISLILMMFYYKPFQIKHFLPLLVLLGLPVWLYVHYRFFPVDIKLQWYDLSGTWLRVTMGILIAFSLGKILVKKPSLGMWIYVPYIMIILITIILYSETALQNHQFVVRFFTGLFKTKIAGAYFMVFTCLMSYGLLLILTKTQSGRSKWLSILRLSCIILICLSFAICLLIQSLIGIVFCALMGFVCVVLIIFKNNHSKFLSLTLFSCLLALFLMFIQYDAKYEGKLANLKNDILISLDIEKNKTWSRSNDVADMPDPIDQNGRTVNRSTYDRTSWFIKGTELLIEHPLGTGFSWSAFSHYMTIEYPGTLAVKTHSAWLDFALGVGIPGLLLVWTAIFLTLKKAFSKLQSHSSDNNAWIVIFVIIGISLFWLVGEVSEREFIEHFFFIIALSASYLGHLQNSSSEIKSKQ